MPTKPTLFTMANGDLIRFDLIKHWEINTTEHGVAVLGDSILIKLYDYNQRDMSTKYMQPDPGKGWWPKRNEAQQRMQEDIDKLKLEAQEFIKHNI